MPCLFFTSDELAAFVADGGTIVSGPYSDQNDCLAACDGGLGSGPHPCPCGWPIAAGGLLLDSATFTVTEESVTGCECAVGEEIEMVWNPALGAYYGIATWCGQPVKMTLTCSGGNYIYTFKCNISETMGVVGGLAGANISCDPFYGVVDAIIPFTLDGTTIACYLGGRFSA